MSIFVVVVFLFVYFALLFFRKVSLTWWGCEDHFKVSVQLGGVKSGGKQSVK